MKTIRAGFGRAAIVPDFAVELCGFSFRRGLSQGVYDDIHATAVVLDSGGARLALVVAELLCIDRGLIEEVKTSLQQEFELQPEGVLICCTHTHSAPAAIQLAAAGRIDPRYPDFLKERLVRAVREAVGALAPALAFYGEAPQMNLGVNRRVPSGSGIAFGCNEDGPRDPLVRVLSFRSPQGALLGGISNFGCHPYLITSRPEHQYLISGDFPHWAVAAMESAGGGLFLHMDGAGADVCPRPIPDSADPAKEGGKRYAQRIRAALADSRPIDVARLGGILGQARLPLQAMPPRARWLEALAEGSADLASLAPEERGKSQADVKVIQAERALGWLDAGGGNTLASTVQLLRLGDVCAVGLEHEVCVQVGEAVVREIRQACPRDTRVLVASQANGCLGYIPTDRMIAEGGYETEAACRYYGMPAPFAPAADAALASAAGALATTLFKA